MKLRLHRHRGFTLVELLVVVSIIIALAGMSYPVVLSQMWKAEVVKIINNGKQIATALNDFSTTFNSYPDDFTAERIEEDSAYRKVDGMALIGDTSNPYYRQLLASGKMETELPFFAKLQTKRGRMIEPDSVIANGGGLTPGENAFGYVMIDRGDSTMALSGSSSGGNTPVIVTLPNETANAGTVSYDQDALRGDVFILRADNSATFKPLDENGFSKEIFLQDNRGRETASEYKVFRPEI